MKIKEIHDCLLSLFIRGIGVWLLYGAVPRATDLVYHFSDNDFNWARIWWNLLFLIVDIAIAAYFILGAPPFLKWATRCKGNSN
jgi:hypothetical protein